VGEIIKKKKEKITNSTKTPPIIIGRVAAIQKTR
jgi:hypothetical protein